MCCRRMVRCWGCSQISQSEYTCMHAGTGTRTNFEDLRAFKNSVQVHAMASPMCAYTRRGGWVPGMPCLGGGMFQTRAPFGTAGSAFCRVSMSSLGTQVAPEFQNSTKALQSSTRPRGWLDGDG